MYKILNALSLVINGIRELHGKVYIPEIANTIKT